MNILSVEKKIQVLAALVEGSSIRSTERMTGIHRDTIMRLLVATGENCQALLNERMRGLKVDRLEFDEIWCYVAKKQKRIWPEDDPAECGDQYVFVAIDPVTKLVPSFTVGKRVPATCWSFVADVRERILGRTQITSDGFKPYIRAVDDAFGADADYAMLMKSYGPADDAPGNALPSTTNRRHLPSDHLWRPCPREHLHVVRGAPRTSRCECRCAGSRGLRMLSRRS